MAGGESGTGVPRRRPVRVGRAAVGDCSSPVQKSSSVIRTLEPVSPGCQWGCNSSGRQRGLRRGDLSERPRAPRAVSGLWSCSWCAFRWCLGCGCQDVCELASVYVHRVRGGVGSSGRTKGAVSKRATSRWKMRRGRCGLRSQARCYFELFIPYIDGVVASRAAGTG